MSYPEPRHLGDADVVSAVTGRKLTDEEWADFFVRHDTYWA